MARIIVFTSGKGGVGKTTVSCNIGLSIARHNKRVVMIDADVGLNNMDVVMNIENRIVYDMRDVLAGRCRINEALVQDLYCHNLYMLPSCRSYNQFDEEAFRYLIMRLSEQFDYVLIDCPAGIDDGFCRAVSVAREAIVVTTPHLTAIRDADKVLSLLGNYNLISVSLIINRARGDLMLRGEMLDVGNIVKALGVKLVGVIPDEDYLGLYGRLDIVPNAKNSIKTMDIISSNITDGGTCVYDCMDKYRGVFGKIRMFMKKEG